MLGKLIKYDLKASLKLFLIMHVLFLFVCLMLRIIVMNRIDFNASDEILILTGTLIFTIMTFLILTVNLCTELQVAYRFYRNLFSKEGYLTWTLPVSAVGQLWSKIISGYLLLVSDITVIFAGCILLLTGRNIKEAYSTASEEITDFLGMSPAHFAAAFYLYLVVCSIFSIILIYFCFAVGQLFPSHRVLLSIAVYFIFTFVLQFLYLATDFVFKLTAKMTVSFMGGFVQTLFLSTLIIFFFSIAEYIFTHYMITKRLNLL